MSPHAPYSLNGTCAAEQERSLRLNLFINGVSLANLRLRGQEKILEVGSGLGMFARDMARVTGRRVVCLERNEAGIYRSLELASARGEEALLDVRQGDVTELPLGDDEWGTFDLVHCRHVLESSADPQAAVQMMARALRPGGRMVLAADDHDLLRLWPVMPAVDELWRALIHTIVDQGNDPFVGRKLVAMMRVADLHPVRSDFLFFGGCSGEDRWELVTANLIDLLAGARDEILASTAIAGDLFDEVMESVRDWGERSDSALWYPTCWAEAVKR